MKCYADGAPARKASRKGRYLKRVSILIFVKFYGAARLKNTKFLLLLNGPFKRDKGNKSQSVPPRNVLAFSYFCKEIFMYE